MEHPDEYEIANLFRALPEAQARTFEHLFRCRRCRQLVGRVVNAVLDGGTWPAGELPLLPAATGVEDAVIGGLARIGRRRDQELTTDRARAPGLYDELLSWPEERWGAVAQGEARFRSPALVLLLLGASNEAGEAALGASTAAGEAALRRAEALAGLALDLANAVDVRRFGAGFTSELQARCLAILGGLRRLRGNLSGAEAALTQAMVRLHSDGLETPVRAAICRSLAALRGDQGRLDEALGLLERSATLYADASELQELGLVLGQEGLLRLGEGDAETALAPLQEAVAHLGHSGAPPMPEVAVRLRLALAECYAELARVEDADRVLAQARSFYELVAEKLDRVEFRWIEARIDALCGRRERARRKLRLVFEAFAAARPYDALIAAVDWAEVLLDLERTQELREVRALVMAVLTGDEIHPRARGIVAAAFVLFEQLEAAETLDLMERVRRFLYRVRRNREEEFPHRSAPLPELRWEEVAEDLRREICAVAELDEGVAHEPSTQIDLATRERLTLCFGERFGVRVAFETDPDAAN
ncbi:MAG TPA: hypothetical protein VHQ90_10830 [Thermoanaerobaculia bacterium]|nr:hypothetical protein [Thermoanaerobaculia bacterium]